jgi:hypothetical protein
MLVGSALSYTSGVIADLHHDDPFNELIELSRRTVASVCGLDSISYDTRPAHLTLSYATAEQDGDPVQKLLRRVRPSHAPMTVTTVDLVEVEQDLQECVYRWLCIRCHKNSPLTVDSCPDCHGWGTRRANAWLCEGCRAWRRHHPEVAACRLCRRRAYLDENWNCRLCRKQTLWLPADTDLAAFVRGGHQLFFADMFTGLGVKADRAARSGRRRTRIDPQIPVRHPVEHRQTVAFELPRDLRAGKHHGFPEPRDAGLVVYLDAAAGNLGHRYGWRSQVVTRVRASLHVLLGVQDTPGAPINASDVAALTVLGTDFSVPRTLDVLAATGFLHEDRTPSVERWFANKTA